MNFLIWSSGNPEVSGSNLGSNFYGCRGRLCTHLGMAKEYIANKGLLFYGEFSISSSWSLLSSMSSDPEPKRSKLNPSSSENASNSEKFLAGVSEIRLRGCLILLREKSIKSSTM
jgi:hypothetical protein